MLQYTYPLPCLHCDTAWAQVQNGSLIVDSRHGGQLHTNTMSLPVLQIILAHSLHYDVEPLLCRLPGCNRPWAMIQNGRLFCHVWHQRDHHQNTLSLHGVERLLSAVPIGALP